MSNLSITDAFRKLQLLANNVKKSIYNKNTKETLVRQLEEINGLHSQIEQKIDETTLLENRELNHIIKLSRQLHYETSTILTNKLKIFFFKMPETSFDIKTATALVQPYDGLPAGLDAFVDAVNLLGELIQQTQIGTAIKFVKTRLTGRARSALPETITTLTQIVDAVKQNCASTETPESISAKLKALKTKGDPTKYLDEVESLTSKLTSLYVQSSVPINIATKMATKVGVDNLISNSTDSETRIIMKAAEFSSIQTAIQKFNESTTCAQPSQIFTAQTSTSTSYSRGRNHSRGHFNDCGSHRGTNSRQNRYQNFNQPRYNRPNYSRGRGHYNQPNRFNNYNRENFARMYYTQQIPNQQEQYNPGNGYTIQNQQLPMPSGLPNAPSPITQSRQMSSNHPFVGTLGQFTQ